MTGVTERAILAGGCFWGMQDLLRRFPGVISTRVGYSGGDVPNATYRNHGTHAEAIEITFEPEKTSFRDLLEFFFQIHDPTTKNRGVFERLLPKPLSGEVDELMQALVAGVLFEAVGNPRARPSVHGDVDNAGRIGLLEPRGRVELDREGVIGGVAVRLDHRRLSLCRSALHSPARRSPKRFSEKACPRL